jgi:ferritin
MNMRLSQSLNDAYLEQIVVELGNVTKYMQICSYFEDLQLKKLSKYFLDQANQEKSHADKFMQHVNDRIGGNVQIGEVSAPNLSLSDPASIGEIFIKVEQDTTNSIESLYELANDEKSYIDLPFILDMLNEQVEEEDSASAFALKIKMCRDIVLFDATFE